MRRRLLAFATISAILLSACGVRGSLKTPPPLWGDKDKAKIEQPTGTDEESMENLEDTDDLLPDVDS